MAIDAPSTSMLSRLSTRIVETMGLHYPPERWGDLQRGLEKAARDFGFKDVESCGDWLSVTNLDRQQMQVLANHLTIGETYFMREQKTFAALAQSVLPELIQSRRERGRRLRIWSAACCTGEEPYSLAILLPQVIPDFAEWHVTILATDINSAFLQKAVAGIYSEWSFRDTPPLFKQLNFRQLSNGRYEILPEIRKRVKFAHLNLVEDVFPALETDTNAMDIVFCRNVLMYFSEGQVRKVIGNLRRSLVEDGWLAVSPSEASHTLYAGFKSRSFPGVILYRNAADGVHPPEDFQTLASMPVENVPTPEVPEAWPDTEDQPEVAAVPESSPVPFAAELYAQGRYAEAAQTLLDASPSPHTAPDLSLLARALANQGDLGEALAWCDRWVAVDKLDASAHYLRAVILQELGNHEPARQALQRAIYLQPELVLPHFAMGNLVRSQAGPAEAQRHFSNALHLLAGRPPEEVLPESDGLTAGRLTEIIKSLLVVETV